MTDSNEPTNIETHDEHAQEVAHAAAQYANTAYISSRRGTLPSDQHQLVVYDNNPYEDKARRPRQLAALVEALKARGAKLAAQAHYPSGVESDEYTAALVFKPTSGEIDLDEIDDEIGDIWGEIIRADFADLDNT